MLIIKQYWPDDIPVGLLKEKYMVFWSRIYRWRTFHIVYDNQLDQNLNLTNQFNSYTVIQNNRFYHEKLKENQTTNIVSIG